MKKNRKGIFDINATNVMSTEWKRHILGEEESHPVRNFFSKTRSFLGRTLLVLLVLNPLLFWLWVYILPKWMGKILSDGSWENSLGSLKKLSIRTAEKILPEGRLFSFMENVSPAECSIKNQLRFFYHCHITCNDWKLSWFSAPAQKQIWAEYCTHTDYPTQKRVAEVMLEQGYAPDDDEKCILIEKGYCDIIVKHWNGKTLSKRVMQALYACRPCDTKEVFFSLVAHNGANGIDLTMVCEADRPRLIEALREYSQVSLIRREQQRGEDGSSIFFNLVKNEMLHIRAEKKMSLAQYECLLSAGKHLSEEAVLFKADPKLNPSDWSNWAEIFLSHEDLSFPEWQELVLRNPELRELVLRENFEED